MKPHTLTEHLSALMKYAVHLTGDREQAEDLVQNVALRILSETGGVAHLEHPRAYLKVALRNRYLDELRKSRRGPVLVPLPEGLDVPDQSETATVPCMMFPNELVHALPVAMKDVLKLRIEERLSYKEIAVRLDIPVGTVMSRLSRAKLLLKEEITRSPPET